VRFDRGFPMSGIYGGVADENKHVLEEAATKVQILGFLKFGWEACVGFGPAEDVC
jgi:hypothetical protein